MIKLFQVFFPTTIVGLLITEVLLTTLCYVAGHLVGSPYDSEIYFFYEGGAARTLIVVGTIIAMAYLADLYSTIRVTSRVWLFQQFCMAVGVAFLLQAVFGYIDRDLIMSRWQMLIGSTLALIVLPLWRIGYASATLKLLGREKVLFVGGGTLPREICEAIEAQPEFGLESIGYVSDEEEVDPPPALGPWLGTLGQVRDIVLDLKPARVVVGISERRGHMPVNDLLYLRMKGVPIQDAPSLFETVTGRVPVHSLKPSSLLFSTDLGPNYRNIVLQRIYSTLIALVGAIVTLPIMAATALAIRLTSKGPALYSQGRVGKDGRVFKVYKFRSMYVDAEARTGAVWATKNDPRITPLGRWLRKLRLDELPQFFNVLRGDMVIVGPRPERPEFVHRLSEQIPFYGQRHAVYPGITGWAQVSYKYGDTIEDTIRKLEYDLYYLKNLSPSFDAYIIFQTAKVMLLSRGAQ
jgi:sugar transferase (PEP-CTERM system associated)